MLIAHSTLQPAPAPVRNSSSLGVDLVADPEDRYLFKSYNELYLEYCKRTGVQPCFVSKDRGLGGFWIGDPTTAKYVVIHFHGKPYLGKNLSSFLEE
jgi:hypothetical protein